MSLHLGENGAGSNAKLAINLFLGITVQGIAEAVMFAKNKGIDTEDMMTIINESACGSAISRLKTHAILAGEFPAAFALKHMAKDLRLAFQNGARTPLAETVYGTYQHALESELGDLDVMGIMRHLTGPGAE
ncbi:NAD-binding protein [Brevibacillus dissolubilis]|uniref:NAD-binding protein n=1 Tax=Brevibacillus dissolubilis TaxID=1844116 RepID=UPI0034CFC1C2